MRATASAGAEAMVAARNALTLGTSLVMTGSLALIVRLLVPRFLGPEAFGEYRFAETIAELLFVVLTLGVDAHMRREAALDPSRAKGYLSGLAALRLALSAIGIAVAIAFFKATGASPTVMSLFVLIAMAQVLQVLNNSYAAFEHASGEVRWLARTSMAMKIIWAVAVVGVLTWTPTGAAVATAALAIEGLRFGWLTWRGIGRHKLTVRPDLRLAASAIVVSLPFFVNVVAHSFYARIGTGWLAAVSSDHEVGLYGAASNLASIALMGMPLLSWVLVPSAARAAAASGEDMTRLVSGALRLSLLVVVPLAVAFYAGAAFWLELFFGPAYVQAAPVFRVLAPTFALTYASTVCAIALIQHGRIWTVTAISVAGVAVTVVLDLILIPWGARALGAAGGAQGAAWATLATELVVAVSLGWYSRSSWLDARLQRTAASLAAGSLAAVVTSRVLSAQAGLPAFAVCLVAVGALAAVAAGAGGVGREDLRFCRRVLAGAQG